MKGEVLSAAEEGRMAENAFGVVCAGLMEAIHVELSHEGKEVGMFEMQRKHLVGQTRHALDGEGIALDCPADNVRVFGVLSGKRGTSTMR